MRISIRYILFVLLALFWVCPTNASKLDLAKKVFTDQSQPDSLRMESCKKIGLHYSARDKDSAFHYADNLLRLAESIGNDKYVGYSYYIMGSTNLNIGEIDVALEMYHLSLTIFEENAHQKGVVFCWERIGWLCYKQGDYLSALQYYKKAMEVHIKKDNAKGMAGMYSNMAVIFQKQGDYTKALEFYENCFEQGEILNSEGYMALSSANMAYVYVDLEKHNKALKFAQRAMEYYKKIKSDSYIAQCYNLVGTILNSSGENTEAFEYFMKALQISKVNNFKSILAESYVNIGNYFIDQKDYATAAEQLQKSYVLENESTNKQGMSDVLGSLGRLYNLEEKYALAKKSCQEGLQIAENIGAMKSERDNCLCLSNANAGLAKYKASFDLKKRYVFLRDSIRNMDIQKETVRHDGKIAYDKYILTTKLERIQKNELATAQQNKRQMVIYLLSGGGLLAMLLSGFMYNRFRITRNQSNVIKKQKQELDHMNEKLHKDISYAERIQKAVLPNKDKIKSLLPNSFVYFKPKDMVSGDFYWLAEKDGKVMFAACDCTGHGVPGAFMSMIGTFSLDEMVHEKNLTQPNEIFAEVRNSFINELNQTVDSGTHKDGMDAILCSWDKKNKLQFAAAINPVILIRNGEILETKPDRQPVGILLGELAPYTDHNIQIEKGDVLYLFSDGFQDQFGGEKNKKYKLGNLKKLLLSIHNKPMEEQEIILDRTLREWKGSVEQIDDVLIIGVQF